MNADQLPPNPDDGVGAVMKRHRNTRGVRYRELFLIGGNPVRGTWNTTMGLNDPYGTGDTCPPALVAKLDLTAIQASSRR